MPEQTTDSRIMLAAERWHARLRAPDCSAAERNEFQRWHAVPDHAAAFAATQALWQTLGQLADRPELARLSEGVMAELRAERHHSRGKLLVAASLLVAVTCGWLLALRLAEAPTLTYATAEERRTVQLTDGSQIVLNFHTELQVQFENDARSIELRRGEALFAVAHDSKRPFSVAAGDGAVLAVGTRFQVRNESDRVTVTLLEGRVNVDRDRRREHAELLPGDQIQYTSALPDMQRRVVDVESASSWSTGRLRFRDAALGELVAEVNRYSSLQIRLADASLANIPVSGTFAVGDTGAVVDALQALMNVQVARRDDELIVTPR